MAIGPLVGGALTEGLGWEWIFFVNVPIGAGAIALTYAKVAESRDPRATGVDWAGTACFSAALFLLVFALIRGNDAGWGSPQIVAELAAAALLLVAFVAVERGQRRPMLDLALFRKPAFAGASVVAFVLSASMFAMFLYLTLYVQNVLGYSPLEAGLRFLPVSLVSFFVAPVAGRLSARLPVRGLLGLGLIMVAVGLILMGGLSARSDWTALLVGFLVAGAGVGMVNAPLASTAVSVVAPERSGMASGINNTFRQVGIATGIAALGAIFEHRVQGRAVELLSAAPGLDVGRAHQIAGLMGTGQVREAVAAAPPAARAGVAGVARQSFITGINELFVIAAVVALVGAAFALALVRRRDFVAMPAPEPSAAG